MVSHFTVKGVQIPVNLFIERRQGYRASFTQKGLNIRISKFYSKRESEKLIDDLLLWAAQSLEKKPNLLDRYSQKIYDENTKIKCFDKSYTIITTRADRKTIKGFVVGDTIKLETPLDFANTEINPAIISKVLAKHYKPFLKARLNYWNRLFAKQHKTLRLKYNSSNWGSCSSLSNINLSTRLLLCPLPVIDYVIVHELAHLIHPNHSKSFWAEVARVMPDYKSHARWLKTEGSGLDF